jgi:uncharacterized membrane protein (UPF0127 family)
VRSLKGFGVTAVIATVVTLLAASCTSPNTLKPGVDGDAATTVLGPATTDATSTTVDVDPPEPFRQFRSISVRITLADGTTRELCLLLADTDDRRSRGLMEVTDLAGYSGMVFSWGGEAVTSAFYMYKTKLPLSIAYFGADGAFLGSNDMLPCESSNASECPIYPPPAAFTTAVEVPLGELPGLGIGPGSTFTDLGVGCRPV